MTHGNMWTHSSKQCEFKIKMLLGIWEHRTTSKAFRLLDFSEEPYSSNSPATTISHLKGSRPSTTVRRFPRHHLEKARESPSLETPRSTLSPNEDLVYSNHHNVQYHINVINSSYSNAGVWPRHQSFTSSKLDAIGSVTTRCFLKVGLRLPIHYIDNPPLQALAQTL